jgi:FkbM family methyltransferase
MMPVRRIGRKAIKLAPYNIQRWWLILGTNQMLKAAWQLLQRQELAHLNQAIRVVDIGARGGLSCIIPNWNLYRNFKTYQHMFRAIAVEPDVAEATRLKTCSEYELVLDCAASDQEAVRTLYLTAHPAKSSILEPDLDQIKLYFAQSWHGYKIVEQFKVQTTSVDAICEQQNYYYDWLKIDTQGNEFEILVGAEKTLERASVIITELSTLEQYKGQKLEREVIEFLLEKGFDVMDCVYKPQAPYERDYVFLRRLATLTEEHQAISIAVCLSLLRKDRQLDYFLKNIAIRYLSEKKLEQLKKELFLAELTSSEQVLI